MSTNSVNIKVGLDGTEFNKGIQATIAEFTALKATVNTNKIAWQESNLELKKFALEHKSMATQTQEVKDKFATLKATVDTNKIAYSEAKLSLDKYKDGMSHLKNSTVDAKNTISKFNGALATMGVGFSLAAIAGEIKYASTEWESYLKQENILKSELIATGFASGETVGQLEVMAKQYENLTGITDENIMSAQNMILTYRNIGSDIFPQVTQATLDMATVMNHGITPDAGTLTETALRLGKALNDPIKGMTALQRVGVQFTQTQKDQVAQMVKSGDGLDAQKLILEELSKEFGGAAHAAETMGNKYTISVGEMQKATGHFLEGGAGKGMLNWWIAQEDEVTNLINKIRIYTSGVNELSLVDAQTKLNHVNHLGLGLPGGGAKEKKALEDRINLLKKQQKEEEALAKKKGNGGKGENDYNLGNHTGPKGQDAYGKAENRYQDYLSNAEIRGQELTNSELLAAYNKYLGGVKKTAKEVTDFKKGQAQLVKASDKDLIDFKLAQLDVEKYATKKTDEEIYQIDLEKINLSLSKERQGTVDFEQLLAEKYRMIRDHEKKVNDLKSQALVDDLEFNKQELDNKISYLDIELAQHKITLEQKLKLTVDYLEQKKKLETDALNQQLTIVSGNAKDENEVKRSSYKNTESINQEENRVKLELWEKQHAGFIKFADSVETGWGDTVASLVKGDDKISDVWSSLMGGVTNAFGNALGDMTEKWIESGITNMVNSLASGGSSGGGFDWGNLGASALKVLKFADGGEPPVGVPSLVGERGPELFIPNTRGTIIPNHVLTQSSSATKSTSQAQQQQPPIIYNNPQIHTGAKKEDVLNALQQSNRELAAMITSLVGSNSGLRTAIKGTR